MVASKYSLCNTENNTWEFKLYSLFKHNSPNGKSIVYGPNRMDPMEYSLMVCSPNEKRHDFMNDCFSKYIDHGKDKKIYHKRYNLNQN